MAASYYIYQYSNATVFTCIQNTVQQLSETVNKVFVAYLYLYLISLKPAKNVANNEISDHEKKKKRKAF